MRRILLLLALAACGKNDGPSKPEPAPKPEPLPLPVFTDPPVEAGRARATQLSTSTHSACARMSDDTLRCWGDNGWHQLGTDPDASRRGSVVEPAIDGVVQVAMGDHFTCVRKRDRTVWCWGYDLYGELGKADSSTGHTPIRIGDFADAVDLGAGDRNACVVRADGSVWCWGDSSFHQLGDGSDGKRLGPVQARIDSATAVYLALEVCARRADGSLWCWGGNHAPASTLPAAAPVTGVVSAAIGGATCAVRTAGDLHCWGPNDSGQLGRDGAGGDQPGPVPGLTKVTMVATARTHTCAIASGTVQCWGAEPANPDFDKTCLRLTGHTGGAGAGAGGAVANWSYCPVPTLVSGISDAIAVGVQHNAGGCALTRDGGVYCWGPGPVAKIKL